MSFPLHVKNRGVPTTTNIMSTDWMQTFTGRAFFPLDPKPEDVDPRDIAHALGMNCRFNGHVLRFYSVAEHSVRLVLKLFPRKVGTAAQVQRANKLAVTALLHDAAEAYLADVPSPLKKQLVGYDDAEIKVLDAIFQRFDIDRLQDDGEIWKLVMAEDMKMLATEARDVMAKSPMTWNLPPEATPYPDYIVPFADPQDAERVYMDWMNKLGLR